MYFGVIFLAITTEGKEAEYAPLTNLVHVRSVGNPTALTINTNHPSPPPCSFTLTKEYDEVIKILFPALHTDGSAVQKINTAIRLGKLVAAQDRRFEVQHTNKEEKTASSVTKWLGEDRMKALLNMTGCKNKAKLNGAVPIFLKRANTGCESKLFDYIFRYFILMMSTHGTKCNLLKVAFHIINERALFKSAIVSMVRFDLGALCCTHMFKSMLTFEGGFAGLICHYFNVNKYSSVANKYHCCPYPDTC